MPRKSLVAIAVLLFFAAALVFRATAGEEERLLAQGGEAYQKGDYDVAVRCYTEVIRLKPDSAKAYYNRGLAYGRQGNLDREIADYTEAIRLDPESAITYYSRAIAYKKQGDVAKAAEDFARIRQWQVPKSRGVAPISAPVTYEGLMLVLSNEKGAAAIAFTREIQYGVTYRYRYSPKQGKEEFGEGKVFEKSRTIHGSKPDEVHRVNDKEELVLEAGPLHVVWSFAEVGKGYIYYHPEHVRVQIASANDFEKIDLNRFTHEF
jgi:tetratricopeptide (TPR) repeat protein